MGRHVSALPAETIESGNNASKSGTVMRCEPTMANGRETAVGTRMHIQETRTCGLCWKLTESFAGLTVDAVAVQRDITARVRVGQVISVSRSTWLNRAIAERGDALELLNAHRTTHKE